MYEHGEVICVIFGQMMQSRYLINKKICINSGERNPLFNDLILISLPFHSNTVSWEKILVKTDRKKKIKNKIWFEAVKFLVIEVQSANSPCKCNGCCGKIYFFWTHHFIWLSHDFSRIQCAVESGWIICKFFLLNRNVYTQFGNNLKTRIVVICTTSHPIKTNKFSGNNEWIICHS